MTKCFRFFYIVLLLFMVSRPAKAQLLDDPAAIKMIQVSLQL
jgi:hypothetical protein